MKYRLKDKDLQDLLDQISAEDFSAQLKEVASFKDYPNPFARTRTIYFDLNHAAPVMLSVEITPEMVEKVEEYTPKAWNHFPEVTPPEGVWMRLEIFRSNTQEQHLYRKSAKFVRGAWRYEKDEEIHLKEQDDVRFRPWLTDDEIEAERKADYKKDMHPDAIAARRYMGEKDEE